ncbi:hypothetical protein NL676_032982 [Syzygium grande]|nr:hypothetical protein NL676_032982 [Syzygium grande]
MRRVEPSPASAAASPITASFDLSGVGAYRLTVCSRLRAARLAVQHFCRSGRAAIEGEFPNFLERNGRPQAIRVQAP